ncbi:MAG TPA: Gfo/Idh/MocA family oxidoreductase [Blastocatellia bacterium]|jgi:predicted dehydrogenase|nr:Gfo/Idh/MocA family oxidoreductase [Blastocatellia bacterium]
MSKMSRSLNRPVRVGIIGAGNVLWAYLRALDRLIPKGQASLGTVCARRREQWDELGARRPGINLVAEPDEAIRSDADLIVIITPPESHADLVRQALENGKSVLVEKPLATTRAEGERLAELADQRGLHLIAAPFVHLAPTFRAFWERIRNGAIGRPHSARGLYGNAGSTWAAWYHQGKVGPLAEVGVYNLKSLTALLGPVVEVMAAEHTAITPRFIGAFEITDPGHDVSHLILRHESEALSSVVSSHAIQRYRRPALEIYGSEGTANLLGDDWDPRGFEIWRNKSGCWEEYEPVEGTWMWADGLTEAVMALFEGRQPLAEITHDLHLLEVIEAAAASAKAGRWIAIASRFRELDLSLREHRRDLHHLHDHTRPADEQ